MGTTISSKKDFNPILARQPRMSINMPKFQSPSTLNERTSTDPLPIPIPMGNSQNDNQIETIPDIISNEHSLFTPTSRRSDLSLPVQLTNSSFRNNGQPQKKLENEQIPQSMIERNTPNLVRSNLPIDHQLLNSNTVVLSRSIVNENDRRYLKNLYSSSLRPHRTMVERNGKQFVVEVKERVERRYVQFVDETTHKTRFFEVIDCIPYRIIQPYQHQSQSSRKNDTLRSSFRSSQHSTLPSTPHNRLEITASSNSIDNKSSNYNKNNVPFTDDRAKNIYSGSSINPSLSSFLSSSQLTTQNTTNANEYRSERSQPSLFTSSTNELQNTSNQYSSKQFLVQPSSSFREHSPTNSDRSIYSLGTASLDSDEKEGEPRISTKNDQILRSNRSNSGYERGYSLIANNRTSAIVSYGTIGKYQSQTILDPFARSTNPINQHHYRQWPDINCYAEPVTNDRRLQRFAQPDYAPLPVNMKQSNQNEASRSNNLKGIVSYI